MGLIGKLKYKIKYKYMIKCILHIFDGSEKVWDLLVADNDEDWKLAAKILEQKNIVLSHRQMQYIKIVSKIEFHYDSSEELVKGPPFYNSLWHQSMLGQSPTYTTTTSGNPYSASIATTTSASGLYNQLSSGGKPWTP